MYYLERARPESMTLGVLIWRIQSCSGRAELAFLLQPVRVAAVCEDWCNREGSEGLGEGMGRGLPQGTPPPPPAPVRLGEPKKGLLNLGQSRKQITKKTNIRDPFTAIIAWTDCIIRMPGSPRLRDTPPARGRLKEMWRIREGAGALPRQTFAGKMPCVSHD